MKELLFGHLVAFGMMGDKNDLDVAVLGTDELVQQEKKAARQVLLHRVHRPRGIHNADYYGIRLGAHVGHHMPVDHVVLMKRKTLLVIPFVALTPGDRQATPDARDRRTFFIKTNADAGAAVTFAFTEPFGHDLTQNFALHVRQLKILEHNLDEFFQSDISLVVVHSGLITSLILALSAFAL